MSSVDVDSLLKEGYKCFLAGMKKRNLELPIHDSWEVACLIKGSFPKLAAENFLNLLKKANPNYITGNALLWPVLDCPPEAEPYLISSKDAWETFSIGKCSSTMFWQIALQGYFYQYQTLENDNPIPNKYSFTTLYRVAEAIGVSLAFAKKLNCNLENNTLCFCFKWKNLKGRELSSINFDRPISQGHIAQKQASRYFVKLLGRPCLLTATQ